jgi:hypothetical protein
MGCFVGMLIALMVAGTVNLTQLALFFPSKALVSSRYRRIQRFFSEHWIDYNEVAHFIMKLFGFTQNDFYLSLDRTNWKWGTKPTLTCWCWPLSIRAQPFPCTGCL